VTDDRRHTDNATDKCDTIDKIAFSDAA